MPWFVVQMNEECVGVYDVFAESAEEAKEKALAYKGGGDEVQFCFHDDVYTTGDVVSVEEK